MPKEVIRGPGAPLDESGQIVYPVVEVRWSAEAGHVQLVTRQVDEQGEPYFPKLEPIEVEPILGRTQYTMGYIPQEQGELLEAEGMRGVFVDLDRRACNELVTVVRTARDKTFGRDA